MKSIRVLTCACALALVTAVGCSNAAAPDASVSETAQSESITATETSATSPEESTSADSVATSANGSVASSQGTSTESTAAAATSSAGVMTASAADSQGYQVFEGTVHVVKAEELLKLQGDDLDPALLNGQNGTYAVVVFEGPVDVTGEYADGSGQTTRSSKMIGVAELSPEYDIDRGDLESWRSLDEQKVKIGVKAEDVMFPSDVRLPINEPTTGAAILIKNA